MASDPGSGGDFTARLIAREIQGPLGQTVIIDNRSSNLLGGIVAHATPDGYTLLVEAVSFWVAPLLQKMPYDALADFSPIVKVTAAPWCLVVHPSVAANTVRELIDLARAKPGELNYASAGIGGGANLAGELFRQMAGINIVHIPFKGSGAAAIGLISGQAQLTFGNPPAVMPHVKSGKLRALAITSARPSALFPGLPTVAASGLPGYDVTVVTGVFAPARTPPTVIARVNAEVNRALKNPAVRELFANTGAETAGGTPEDLLATVKADLAKWGKVIKEAGIRVE